METNHLITYFSNAVVAEKKTAMQAMRQSQFHMHHFQGSVAMNCQCMQKCFIILVPDIFPGYFVAINNGEGTNSWKE